MPLFVLVALSLEVVLESSSTVGQAPGTNNDSDQLLHSCGDLTVSAEKFGAKMVLTSNFMSKVRKPTCLKMPNVQFYF